MSSNFSLNKLQLARFQALTLALALFLSSGLTQIAEAKGRGHGGRAHVGRPRNNVMRLFRGHGHRGRGRNYNNSQIDTSEADKAAYFEKRRSENPYATTSGR